MNVRKKQLIGIVCYSILSIIFIYNIISYDISFDFYSRYSIIGPIIFILVFQNGLILLVSNYIKPKEWKCTLIKIGLYLRFIIAGLISPLVLLVSIIGVSFDASLNYAFVICFTFIFSETLLKIFLAIYNRIVAKEVYKQINDLKSQEKEKEGITK